MADDSVGPNRHDVGESRLPYRRTRYDRNVGGPAKNPFTFATTSFAVGDGVLLGLLSDTLQPSALPTLTVDLSRPGGEVIDMAAHRGAPGHAADIEAVDFVAEDGVSAHNI